MTEEEWLTSDCSHLMFEFVRRRADRRKVRLYACACCRQIWPLLTSARSRNAVEVTERYADGRATKEELSAAEASAAEALRAAEEECRPWEAILFRGYQGLGMEERETAEARWLITARRRAAAKAAKAVARSTDRATTIAEEMHQAAGWALGAQAIGRNMSAIRGYLSDQSDLIRCVFGNPFRPTQLAASWVTADVALIAQAIYNKRSFEWLPVLAELLEKAGCENADALAHCRRAGPHVRGCWVVDLLLAGAENQPAVGFLKGSQGHSGSDTREGQK